MKTIEIDVKGTAGGGKSTMVELLSIFFKREGFNCFVSGNEYEEKHSGYFQKRAKAIKEHKVIITSTQINRSSNESA